ncbi:EpsD family peptidyl-prolyl cis-trans isomerase [Chitinivorax tropicus]|uniref:EpsD family peptidyl-prolyl cis-trans isomerase n=2 Tax=Chitinivorax tropicus TaxID=714531 RepID=A0A840MLJ8_9PROT|nr:EpsD family peptidyl-prolyl cis-trans isomerase [Chitinivorax tropicus]
MPLVRVDESLITQVELDRALQRSGKPEGAAKQVLENMVDQHLLASQAQREHLDQDPMVKDALEAARRQVLAQALLERRGPVQPTEAEIAAYYDRQTVLFSARRVFGFQSISIAEPKPGLESRLKQDLQSGLGLSELVSGLERVGYKLRTAEGTAGPEQFPAYLYEDLKQVEPGQIVVAGNDQTLTVLNILSAKPRPLSLSEAKPIITRYLVELGREESAKQLVKSLRQSIRVDYLTREQALAMGSVITLPPQ